MEELFGAFFEILANVLISDMVVDIFSWLFEILPWWVNVLIVMAVIYGLVIIIGHHP